jgi:hypothetical protein
LDLANQFYTENQLGFSKKKLTMKSFRTESVLIF